LVPADDFEAVFVTEAGVQHRVPWRRLPNVVDDLGATGSVIPLLSR
jgi:hypothetical protein